MNGVNGVELHGSGVHGVELYRLRVNGVHVNRAGVHGLHLDRGGVHGVDDRTRLDLHDGPRRLRGREGGYFGRPRDDLGVAGVVGLGAFFVGLYGDAESVLVRDVFGESGDPVGVGEAVGPCLAVVAVAGFLPGLPGAELVGVVVAEAVRLRWLVGGVRTWEE